jgi:hypothetical protein
VTRVKIINLFIPLKNQISFLGGGCWGAYGLIGMNVAVTTMPSTTHFSAISEAAIYSPKNIIVPSPEFKTAFLVFF